MDSNIQIHRLNLRQILAKTENNNHDRQGSQGNLQRLKSTLGFSNNNESAIHPYDLESKQSRLSDMNGPPDEDEQEEADQ